MLGGANSRRKKERRGSAQACASTFSDSYLPPLWRRSYISRLPTSQQRTYTRPVCVERGEKPGHGRGVHRWTARRSLRKASASSARWSRIRRRGSRQSSGATCLTCPFQAVRETGSPPRERGSAVARRWMSSPCGWSRAPGSACAARQAWRRPGARPRSASTAFFLCFVRLISPRTTLRSQQHVTRRAWRGSFPSSSSRLRGVYASHRTDKSALPRRKSRSGSKGHVTHELPPDSGQELGAIGHVTLPRISGDDVPRSLLRSPLVFQRRGRRRRRLLSRMAERMNTAAPAIGRAVRTPTHIFPHRRCRAGTRAYWARE